MDRPILVSRRRRTEHSSALRPGCFLKPSLSSLDLPPFNSSLLELHLILSRATEIVDSFLEGSSSESLDSFVIQCKEYLEAIKSAVTLPLSEVLASISPKTFIDDFDASWTPKTALSMMTHRAEDLVKTLAATDATLFTERLLSSLPSRPSLSSSMFEQRPTLSRLRKPTLSDIRDAVEHASEAFSQKSTEIKRAFTEERERIAGVLEHELELFTAALHAGRERLLKYHELPVSWRNNQHILTGYRFIPARNYRQLFGSLFSWHNETLNIYTHIFGLFLVLYLVFFVHPSSPQAISGTILDSIVSLSFLACAAGCLALSAAWHLFSGCSDFHVFKRAACLDYCGVSALIAASIFALVYYGFYCEPALFRLYGTGVLLTGLSGIIFPFQDWFDRRENKPWRILFFLSMCLSAVVPQIHLMILHGMEKVFSFYLLTLASVACYIVGLLLYAFHIPESFTKGGIFDTVAHSHQFWHCAIICAIAIQYYALLKMHDMAMSDFSCSTTPHQESFLQAVGRLVVEL